LQSGVDVFAANQVCGVPDIEPEMDAVPAVMAARIVGGKEATPYSWPWQCYLLIKYPGGSASCGGTIIGSRYILTAAHCL